MSYRRVERTAGGEIRRHGSGSGAHRHHEHGQRPRRGPAHDRLKL